MPRAMKEYLGNYGWHFSKTACEHAVSLMRRGGLKVEPWTREQVDELLSKYGVRIKNGTGYDHVYVANMCKADYYKSSIMDDQHVALYIRDVMDDEDDADGNIMRRWYASMTGNGEAIEWSDMM